MQISLLLFAILFGALLFVAYARRAWLLTAWSLLYLVFPTTFAKAGDAPIYLYDAMGVLVLATMWLSGDARRWPARVPQWHWWFVISAFGLSVLGGVLRYGMVPEILWIWGHTSLAWMAFAIGLHAVSSDRAGDYCAALRIGIFFSSLILCGIAVVQFLDLPGAEIFPSLFYGDLGRAEMAEVLRHSGETMRANGPHSAPPGFAGMALLSIVAYWLVSEDRHKFQRWLVLLSSSATMLCTVSRHAVLAALLGIAVTFALSETRRRARFIAFAAVLVIIVGSTAAGLVLKESWTHRLSKTDEGVLADDNIAARVVWGPMRLAEFIAGEPSVLLTGAGLDPEKLEARAQIESGFETGFVSNGFLLPLYYLGGFGFLLHAAFWIWALRLSWTFPNRNRGLMVGFIAMIAIIVASDNYGFMYEPAVSLLNLIVGSMAGHRHLLRLAAREAAIEVAPASMLVETVTGGSRAA